MFLPTFFCLSLYLFLLLLAPSFFRISRRLGGAFPFALFLLFFLLFVLLHELCDEVRAVQVLLWLPRVILTAEFSILSTPLHIPLENFILNNLRHEKLLAT